MRLACIPDVGCIANRAKPTEDPAFAGLARYSGIPTKY